MKRRLSPDDVRRVADLELAKRLAERGQVAAARAIFASYGVSHAAVELSPALALARE